MDNVLPIMAKIMSEDMILEQMQDQLDIIKLNLTEESIKEAKGLLQSVCMIYTTKRMTEGLELKEVLKKSEEANKIMDMYNNIHNNKS